ncbi:MAG: PLP-dependent aminotransferase family protein [Meiothermus sp.]|nr:PLP-dependent aminotransferase family protein [Meiothermus sp.]
MPQTRLVSEFLPVVQRGIGVSLERQLVQAFRSAILEGRLHQGARIPSSRELAASLGVNRNTVVAALEQLRAEGCLEAIHGSGTFVSADVRPPVQKKHPVKTARWLRPPAQPLMAPLRGGLEFRVCQISTRDFPLEAWHKAWREAARKAPPDDYGTPAGEPAFRQAIARYLGRARGLACTAEDVLVTGGAIQAINLIAQATLTAGTAVAFEDPGFPLARQVLQQHGARILPVAVDEDGLRVDQLPTGRNAPHLVYVTPSHQFPLGSRLSLSRRRAVLEWADQNDALIIEDDYDSEFRFDVPPLPPLASLDRSGRVVYVGTFSKVLSPALRTGYVVAAPALLERLSQLKTLSDYYTSSITQLALEHFLSSGALERHVAKMRRVYKHKREALVEALAPIQDVTRVRGLEAGVNVFLECGPGLDLEQVERHCARQGVGITGVATYFCRKPDWYGLVLGYGGLELGQIREAAGQLVRAVKGASFAG